MSEKQDKFEKLAEKRVTEAIKKLRLIGNLSNKNNYDYTEEHAKQIIDTLENEMKILKSKFKDESGPSDTTFSFKK
ncbi:hypothetical protein [Exiguobacterium sp. AB2]|uniref:hypothetical protein n=1 Tax=Exiguobacterium sp. AB2 TaxID=1484479 RepID=UPI0004A90617|nr:hypothetical protein [Exiguobacterium sp. AB2]KDN57501.1 histidine kinase [Exiguobacterium sp. AB2]